MQRQITSLEPDPQNPNISKVTFDDGGIYTLPSAQLQQAYQQQQAAKQASMLAEGFGPTNRAAQLGNMGNGAQLARDYFNQAAPAPSSIAPLAPPDQVPASLARPPDQPLSPAQQEIGNIQGAGYRWTAQDEAEARMHPELTRTQILAARNPAAATKAITQADWQKRAGQGTTLPTAQSTTLAGKAPVSDEDLQKITDSQTRAANATANYLEAESNAKTEQVRAQALADRQYADQQAADVARKDSAWNDAWAKFQQQTDPNAEQNQVDPQRWFKQKGALGGMLAIIGGAMQTMGNVYTHQANAGTAVERAIERDVQAQIAEIQARRGHAQNQLMILSQQFGSLEAGKQALVIAQKQALASKLADVMQGNIAPAERQRLVAEREKLQADVLEGAAKLKALYGGSISQTTQGQVMYPQAARAGGPRYSERAIQGLGKEGREETRKDLELGIKAQEAGAKTITAEQAQKLGEYTDVRDRVLELAKLYGLNFDPKTGQVTKPSGWSNPFAYSPLGETRWATDQQQKITALTDQIIPLYTHAQMGRVTEQDLEIARKNFYGSNPAQTPEALNAIMKTVSGEIEKWGAAVNPNQRVNAAQGVRREKSFAEDEPLTPRVK